MQKILWVKFGWSDFYQGGLVDGDFPYIEGGRKKGHEAWNFQPQINENTYYCYTPLQGGTGVPFNSDPYGWTVICLAKKPKETGIYIVGWYEDAELVGAEKIRPPGFFVSGSAPEGDYYYTILSKSVWFVPPELRKLDDLPFSHKSVGQGKYSFLAGPKVEVTDNKIEVLRILRKGLKKLQGVATHNPKGRESAANNSDPLAADFGTPEHRKAVELAAIKAATLKLKKNGYDVVSVEKDNLGYDLQATHKKDSSALHVEVKGTSSAVARFFMTANEYKYRTAGEWRLAMVTDALSKAEVKLYNLAEVESDFSLKPMVWRGIKKATP